MPTLFDPALTVTADALTDVEQTRIAVGNRLSILTKPADEPDEDGVCRGFGLSDDHPAIASARAVHDGLTAVEAATEKDLRRLMRAHPLGPWVAATNGLGDKQVARLLAAVGDPYWNAPADRPRRVSSLWAYCGMHVVTSDEGPGSAPKRRRGQQANWNPQAQSRAYLVATSCVKQAASPYRAVYLARRAHTAVTHPDWDKGHSHADGLRVTAKRILQDLWRESARLHGADPDEGRWTPGDGSGG